MDYKAIHDQIIQNRKQFPFAKGFYTEKHHIIPKSLGGSNSAENIVRLSAREHFIIHVLLVKIYPKGSDARGKMICALRRFRNGNKEQQKVSARLYEYYRIEHALTTGNRFRGRKCSDETKLKMRLAKQGKPRSLETIEKMKEGSKKRWGDPEYKAKQDMAREGRTLSESHRQNIGRSGKGRKHTEETKAKISATKKSKLIG